MRKLSLADVVHVCEHQTVQVPDGGWGWMVTFSSFIVNALIDGVSFTFGIFFPEFLRYFGESKAKTQMLHSVLVGTLLVFGPVVSVLMNKYGSRRVAGSGAVIVSVGLFLSSFSPSLDVMIIFYSIAGGIGFGLLYLPSIVIIGTYFDKRRALATGMAVCGAGVGAFAFAPLSEFLLETYGWRGTMWIMSAIVLNGVVCSAVYRPLETSFDRNVQKIVTAKYAHDNFANNCGKCCQKSCSPIKAMFDFTLLKSPTMLMYGASCLFVMFGFFIPLNFLPVWASEVNLSSAEGAFLISFMGISNTVTRVLIGYITDKPWANSLIINNTALLIGGVSTCFVPFYTTFVTLTIYAVVFGAVLAAFICLRSILMAELLGVHRLSSSFGLVGLSMGLSSFVGSPIAGALSDMSGSYNLAFYFGGITLGLGGLICLPLRRISEWEKSRNIEFNLSVTCDVGKKEDSKTLTILSIKRNSSIYTIPIDG
ncbi:monocarboxylate transporter 13-like [Mizuhopecten yessoensis]|uniref:monocarboxylate transporter 13-like n=1 Tax=Mizuhopecten yessoensis TaxID=6573 RepID=UPI000B45D7AF|nr:monocarboxylate transporter 13-like [Mizuhopecten yessoensis]